MKNFYLKACVLAAFASLSILGMAQSFNLSPIVLNAYSGDIIDDSPRNHRAPAKNPVLPEVSYDAAEGVLLFESEACIDALPVTIADENGNVVIRQTVSIQADCPATINIISLADGLYRIKMPIAGRTYIGEFEIGE